MERQRTAGMTAIAVLNIVFGGVGILNGLFLVLGAFALMVELSRLGVFEIPVARLAFALLIWQQASSGSSQVSECLRYAHGRAH